MPTNRGEGIYDPANNVTHFYDNGKYVGAEPGDVSGGKARNPGNLGDYTQRTPGGGSSTDWGKYVKDNVTDLIPAAVTMAAPELRGMGALGKVLAKMGIATGAGAAADVALNAGNDKSKTQSVVDSLLNSVLGIGVPELMPGLGNVGIEMPGMSRNTTINRSNSGTAKTSSTSSTTSGPVMAPGKPTYVPGVGPQGQALFGKMVPGPPEPTLQSLSTSTGNSSTSSGGVGQTAINREVGYPGLLGHLLDIIKNTQSVSKTNKAGTGPRLDAIRSALIGLGLNMGTDASVNRPQE